MIALIDAITTQIYLDMFVGGFRIGVSVILLPIFYFFDRKINPLICALFVGVVGLFFRGLVGLPVYELFWSGVQADFPIFVFDMAYGLLYFFLFSKSEEQSLTRWALAVLFADFTANCLEIVFRTGPFVSENIFIVNKLFLVASVRTLIGVVMVLIFKHYKRLLKKEEHENRYRELITWISDLKAEVYFMSSNMESIEAVMGDAFSLYENFGEEDSEKKILSLQIAKDIHEIKKNYLQVIHGIENLSQKEFVKGPMPVKDVYVILHTSLSKELEARSMHIKLKISVKSHARVANHFLLMSILRNLAMNSLEAMENQRGTRLEILHEEKESLHEISISDNGPGISSRNLEHIYDPGFSTKFDEKTGNINRGVGLTLVCDVVKNHFQGEIVVNSKQGKGTTFFISIPKEKLEERP